MKKCLLFVSIFLSMQLLQAQNVGVGTAVPSEKLHVNGNIKSDTLKPNALKLVPNSGAGKILTSDVNGNASWQSSAAASGNIGYGVWGDCAANGNISGYQPIDDSSATAGDGFGQAISVSGEFAVIGNDGEHVNGNFFQGSASIYRHNGTSWEFFQKITDPTGATGDHFGSSVSISGNFLVCGADHDMVGSNALQGSVSVFRYNGSSWILTQKITDPNGNAEDIFGKSVSMSGNFMIVGAYLDDNGIVTNSGSVSFYRYNGTSWIFMQKSVDPGGAASDLFGSAVSISENYAVVGSPEDDDSYSDQGSVTIYRFNGINNFVRLEKVVDGTPVLNEEFGSAVSNSGSDIFIGSFKDNNTRGKVSFYRYINNNGYALIQVFYSSSTESGTISFGYTVMASGNFLLIGSPGRDFDTDSNFGELVLYQRVGNTYYKMQSIRDPGAVSQSQFGGHVALDGTSRHFISSNHPNSSSSKVVFGKIN